MTAPQMRSWLDSQGVHVGKVKVVPGGGIDVDPQSEHDEELIRDMAGRPFERSTEAVRVQRLPTPPPH